MVLLPEAALPASGPAGERRKPARPGAPRPPAALGAPARETLSLHGAGVPGPAQGRAGALSNRCRLLSHSPLDWVCPSLAPSLLGHFQPSNKNGAQLPRRPHCPARPQPPTRSGCAPGPVLYGSPAPRAGTLQPRSLARSLSSSSVRSAPTP